MHHRKEVLSSELLPGCLDDSETTLMLWEMLKYRLNFTFIDFEKCQLLHMIPGGKETSHDTISF